MIWIMIMMIVALALIGVPMSFSMLTGSVWFMLTSGMPQTLMIQRLIMAVGDSFSMLAIPFFMLAGTIMNAGGVAARIFDFCNTLVGHIPGRLGHVNVFCSVIFAGMSGSALADTGGIGAIALRSHPRGRGRYGRRGPSIQRYLCAAERPRLSRLRQRPRARHDQMDIRLRLRGRHDRLPCHVQAVR